MMDKANQSAQDMSNSLPKYDRPPVVEVACSVQFEELSRFQTPYAGFLWQEYRKEYPRFEEKPPLPHMIETFPEPTQPRFTAAFSELPPPRRIFFLQADGTNLIQIQPDRFVHNWRKMRNEDDYPSYDKVRAIFLRQWSRFVEFAQTHGLGKVQADQYELTYVNHLVRGEAWETLADVAQLFRDISWADGERFLPAPEDMLLRRSFGLPQKAGRLHVSVRKAARSADRKELLMLELTARGFPAEGPGGKQEAMQGWFDLAHEWIVKGFEDLTTNEAQEGLWRKRK